MKLGAFVGWGIVIYAVTRLAWEGLVLYGFSPHFKFIVLAVVCLVAGRALRFSSWKDIAPYAVSWAAISMVLDVVYVVPFFGWSPYADAGFWFAYALIAFLPLFAPQTRRVRDEMPQVT
jgi:hypothetical protein